MQRNVHTQPKEREKEDMGKEKEKEDMEKEEKERAEEKEKVVEYMESMNTLNSTIRTTGKDGQENHGERQTTM